MEIQILSLIIALLAVIVNPLINYHITNKNLEFQFRTQIKEQWVGKLEDAAIKYLSFTLEWIERYRALVDQAKSNPSESKIVNSEIDRLLNGINSSFIMLQLHLRQDKSDQKLVLDKAVEMKVIVNRKAFDEESISKLRECHENIILLLQRIFHQERTKTANLYRNSFWRLFKKEVETL